MSEYTIFTVLVILLNQIPLKVTGARMFLMASPSLQLAHFFVGLFVFVSGAGLSYWGTKKAPGREFNRHFGLGAIFWGPFWAIF